MAVYTISDLHLSFSCNKPMSIFKGWENHTQRIAANWRRLVTDDDTVVLPGDFSWGLKIDETIEDFKYLESLPGQKIILKGNHDLWWGTKKKITEFFEQNGIKTVNVLYNNAYFVDGIAICGTRGWFYDCAQGDDKIIMREAGRLETSLSAAAGFKVTPTVFLHYPPVYKDYVCGEIIDVLKRYNIKKVYHGHIHGAGLNNAVSEYDGISFKLVSCDCIGFTPVRVC